MGWKISPQGQVKWSHESSNSIFMLTSWRNVCICALLKFWLQLPLYLMVSTHFHLNQCLSSLLPSGHKRGAWSLVCDTEEQWVSLAESIKDKTSPQDRHLYRVISQNFLPEISSMIEHKVRHQRQDCYRSHLQHFIISSLRQSLDRVCQLLPKAVWLSTRSWAASPTIVDVLVLTFKYANWIFFLNFFQSACLSIA